MIEMLREQESPVLARATEILAALLPDLDALSLYEEVTYRASVPSGYLLDVLWYSASYSGAVLVLALLVFEYRQID
jgi:hypothetical protein